MNDEGRLVIGIVAPSSTAKVHDLRAGIEAVRAYGHRPVMFCNADCVSHGSESGFTSGSKEERVDALYRAFEDDAVDALICLRGGTGASELLPLLDFKRIAKCPKPFVGFSDITALLHALYSCAGVPTIHGCHIAGGFAKSRAEHDANKSVEALLRYLGGARELAYEARVIRESTHEAETHGSETIGRLLPGNLTVLTSLLGTPWDVDYTNAILVVEDVNEAPYRIWRSFTHLLLAGKLDQVVAVVLGSFGDMETFSDTFLDRLAGDALAKVKGPVLSNFPIGHGNLNMPIPVGCVASIVGNTLRIVDRESVGEFI